MSGHKIVTLGGAEISLDDDNWREYLIAAVIHATLRASDPIIARLSSEEEASAELRLVMSTETAYVAGQLAVLEATQDEGAQRFIKLARDVSDTFDQLIEELFAVSKANYN